MDDGASRRALDAAATHDVVVVDHYDSYTWNLAHLIAEVTGSMPEVVEHDRVRLEDLARFSHLVLSPGPGHPRNERDFALGAGVFDLGIPILGVCLGMQAIVHFHGGEVAQAAPAHGVVATIEHDATGIFSDIPVPFDGVRYHSLAAISVPRPLRVTAWQRLSETAEVVMAVEHCDRRIWGVQFHPESILSQYGAQLVGNFLA